VALPRALLDASGLVEQGLRSSLEGRDGLLYRMVRYSLGWCTPQGDPLPGPPPLHPYGALGVLGGQAIGLPSSLLAPVGAAVELLALFHQVHRQVQEGIPGPQERPSLWWVWGPAQAINAGDGLHALARLVLLGLRTQGVDPLRVIEALQALDATALELCEGRFQDLLLQERLDVTVGQCQRIARSQTGALMACALRLPALLGGMPPGRQDLWEEAGRRLGMAIHYWHDLRRWRSPAPEGASGPLLNKGKTLPLALALQGAGPAQKREIGALYAKRVLEPADLQTLLSLLEQVGALPEAEAMAQQALEEGLALWGEASGASVDPAVRQAVSYLATAGPL
jgi:geranylgeranyl diphosphate synthase type I